MVKSSDIIHKCFVFYILIFLLPRFCNPHSGHLQMIFDTSLFEHPPKNGKRYVYVWSRFHPLILLSRLKRSPISDYDRVIFYRENMHVILPTVVSQWGKRDVFVPAEKTALPKIFLHRSPFARIVMEIDISRTLFSYDFFHQRWCLFFRLAS